MKKFLLVFILFSSFTVHARDTVIILSTPDDVFSFQVGKLMKGGQVEIYDPAGKLITAEQISTRKMVIELPDLVPGEYTIKIVKYSKDHTFDYHAGSGQSKVQMRDEITVTLTIETPESRQQAVRPPRKS